MVTEMSIASHHVTFTTGMGILGNTVAVMVYLSPLPTFIRIYKKQSTEEFESVPYLVALFSAMLWLYYALLEGNNPFLMSINVVGCAIQSVYVAIYFAYAPKHPKIWTAKLLCVILVMFSSIFVVVHFLKISSSKRLQVLGVICVIFSISVFIAPLTIMVKVVQTRSVRFMPFPLSFFLTLNAIIWFFYGLLRKDGFIWLPNVVGFIFGLLQMATYAVCKYSFREHDKTISAQAQALDKEVGMDAGTPQIQIQIHQNYGQLESKRAEDEKSNLQDPSKASITYPHV